MLQAVPAGRHAVTCGVLAPAALRRVRRSGAWRGAELPLAGVSGVPAAGPGACARLRNGLAAASSNRCLFLSVLGMKA